jgi:hypothetical protein
VRVRVQGISGNVKIVPDKAIHVRAGEIKKFPVYISARDLTGAALTRNVGILIESVRDHEPIERNAHFIIPEER